MDPACSVGLLISTSIAKADGIVYKPTEADFHKAKVRRKASPTGSRRYARPAATSGTGFAGAKKSTYRVTECDRSSSIQKRAFLQIKAGVDLVSSITNLIRAKESNNRILQDMKCRGVITQNRRSVQYQ